MVRGRESLTFVPSAAGGRIDRVSDQAQDVGQRPTEDAEDERGEETGLGHDQPVLDKTLAGSSVTARHT